MRSQSLAPVLCLVVTITAACGYHLRNTTSQVPPKMKSILLNSYDPYGPLTRALRAELHLNNVMLLSGATDKHGTLPSLELIRSSESQVTASVLQDGKTAEYQLTLSIQAKILIPGKDYYPIDVKIYRYFFDNPLTALAKNSERDMIRHEMHQQAAQKLVRKLMAVYPAEEADNSLNAKTAAIAPADGGLMKQPLVSRRSAP